MDRRRFVGSATLLALGPLAGPLLSGCVASDGAEKVAMPVLSTLSNHEMQTLLAIARALFPHQNAPHQPYLDAVAALDRFAMGDDSTAAMLRSAVSGLDDAAGGRWLSTSPERKVEILERQQSEPYFALVLNTTIDAVYRNPNIWALIGYEGSSLEHGGYLRRGFDDIDWLPVHESGDSQ